MKTLIPPPVWGLLTLLAIWATHYYYPQFSVSFVAQTYLAIVFIGLGGVIDLISIFAFRRAKTTINPLSPQKSSALVTNGLYKYSRNPMYVGMLFILIGFALRWGVVIGAFYIIGFVLTLNYLQIKPEEVVLEKNFAKDYLHYKKSVRRWL